MKKSNKITHIDLRSELQEISRKKGTSNRGFQLTTNHEVPADVREFIQNNISVILENIDLERNEYEDYTAAATVKVESKTNINRNRTAHKKGADSEINTQRNPVLEKDWLVEVNNLLSKLKEQGKELRVFSTPLEEIMDSLMGSGKVEGENLYELSQNPNFRFISSSDPSNSLIVSEIIAKSISYTKSLAPAAISEKGVIRRNEIADEFAISMYEIVNRIKQEKGIKSYRAIAKALNEENIPTYRDEQWHLSSIQNLHKRWKDLGIAIPR